MKRFNPFDVKIQLVTDMSTAFEFLNWIREVPDQLIGLDVETDGLNWFDGQLRLVQFGTLYEGWAVPYEEWSALVLEALQILTNRNKCFVGHNFKFDLHFIERACGWLPKDWRYVHDTMLLASVLNSSASKALKDLSERLVWADAKMGQNELKKDMKENGWTWGTVPVALPSYWVYGVLDTILTVNLFYTLLETCTAAGVMDAYAVEMGAFPVLFIMERKGMLLDREHCITEQNKLLERAEEIETLVFQYGIENIGSTPQIALALENAGIELTEKTGSGRWKMDKDTFDLIAATNNHPLVGLVKEHRSVTKLSSTYYSNFMKFQRSDGRIHPFYWAAAAKTGRMSATEPAILTVPRPDEDKSDAVKQVRNSIVAPEGHVLISSDFSNVEARIFAHYAEEWGMIEAFNAGINLHKFTASQIFGKPIDEIDKTMTEYTVAKNTLFCTLFGGGALKIAITAGITPDEGKAAQDGLYRAFPGIKGFQRRSTMVATDNLRAHGQAFIRGVDGRILAMAETDDRYYAFTNWQIQSTANVVLKKRLAVMHNMGLAEFLIAAIHDEVVAEIPEDFEEEYKHMIAEAMNDDSMFSLPIVSNTGNGSVRWGEVDH